MRLIDFKVLTFDCYGTLIDWETGILQALMPLRKKDPVERPPDEILASFARHEGAQEAETPGLVYSELLARVHRRLAAEWGVAASEAEHRAFGGSVGDWPAFADSAAALAYLKRFYKLVILSNVDRANFARSAKKLGAVFDAVYTAEEIGSYKPDLRNFHHMLDRLKSAGYGEADILHTAQSLFHDHAPANALGLRSAWIDRRGAAAGSGATPPPPEGVHWDFRFAGMAEFVAAHRAECAR
ncbi:MAG TPA: haloacid dehalogenase type II [Stellaceae bacterium]|jgi:2-haloalkanoic acid dehalogenase type II